MANGIVAKAFAVCACIAPLGIAYGQAAQVRDSAGALVGLYVGDVGPDIAQGTGRVEARTLRILSQTGYVAAISVAFAKVTEGRQVAFGYAGESGPSVNTTLLYQQADCEGPAFAQMFVIGGIPYGGFVWAPFTDEYMLFYTPKGLAATQRQFLSIRSGNGACSNGSSTQWSIPALPNDPQITGVPNEPYQPPLTLGYSDTAWLLFRDGFESAFTVTRGPVSAV